MTGIRLILAVLLSLLALTVSGQTDQTVLLPLAPDVLLGAHGSEWVTELAITNRGPIAAQVEGYGPPECGPVLCGPEPPIPPNTTIYTGIIEGCTLGRLLTVDSIELDQLSFSLRSRDTSRDARAWGAMIPVVRESSFFDRPFSITNVPHSPLFRSMLRVYDAEPSSNSAAIVVRYYAVNAAVPYPVAPADRLLAEGEITLQPANAGCPAFAQILAPSTLSLHEGERIRIEIVPLDGRRVYWGFVSVTNNDTQEVSILTP